jgi:hypothetical protein
MRHPLKQPVLPNSPALSKVEPDRVWSGVVRGVLQLLMVAGAASFASPADAQEATPLTVPPHVPVGSEAESYLRLLQILGDVSLYPWTIRALSPREFDRLSPEPGEGPWSGRYSWAPTPSNGFRAGWLPLNAHGIYNSGFPHGDRRGAVWAGRGLTAAIEGGGWMRLGPISATFAPIAFWSQNTDFPLAPNGQEGRLTYADRTYPTVIDAPRRFGSEPYARLDPGQSTIRIDLPVLSAGISTANQHWGPAFDYPILLGNNAPGFLHGWVGTSEPVNLWIARAHGRIVWGRLEQSEYAVLEGRESRRFMSGIIGVVSPRGVPGLELGAARFLHETWPEGGLEASNFLRPLEAFLKDRLPETGFLPEFPKSSPDNQLASAFFRWAFPGSGFEMYGEFGREDHNWDFRDFLLQPDHDSSYMLGFRKAWERESGDVLSLRGELINAEISHLARVREQVHFYLHTSVRQGHTHHGQILGAPTAYGGAGATIAADYHHPGGRWSGSWFRETRRMEPGGEATPDLARRADVQHSLGLESLVFLGSLELLGTVTGVQNLNREFGGDRFNLHAGLEARLRY